MSKKRIVIFGATGTIGAYACVELVKYFDVVAVGHRVSDNGFFSEYGIDYFSVDIRKKDDFVKLPFNNVFGIVHLAGSIPARMKGYNPQEYIDTVMTGTLNVLDYSLSCKADRIVFTQSISDVAYLCDKDDSVIPSDIISKFPHNNDHSIYSICKTAAVNLIEHYFYKYGLKRFVLRLPNIYLFHPNPMYYYDGVEKWQGYRLMIEKAKKSEPIEVWGDPKRFRDIVYVKDCVQMIQKSLEVSCCNGGIYNVGTGVGVTLEDQIKGIIQVFSPIKNQSSIIYRPEQQNATQYIFDISKPSSELGYSPKYDYITYLEDMKMEMSLNRFEKLWGKSRV